jgi:ferric-dicitrate binding protein FerR (iron transport regulator)
VTDQSDAFDRRLADIPVDRILQWADPETAIEWLLARNAQRRERLRAICRDLRAESRRRQRAYERLLAAVQATPAP